jgi:hypothetical protein
MGFLSGILRSVINPMTLAQLAMGPAGWASLAMRTIGTAIAQQVIQQLGQRLGLPQSMISMAQMAFSAASGTQGFPTTVDGAVRQLAQQFNLSPTEQGQLARSANNDINTFAERMFEASRTGKQRAQTEGSREGKGNWLRQLAEAMAAIMDSKMQEMSDLAKTYDGQSKDNKSTKTMTDLQVATQEFSYLMQSTTNMIKTIGEGLSTMARKG